MKKSGKKNLLIDVIIEIVGIVLLAIFLRTMYNGAALTRQESNSRVKLEIAEERINSADQEASENADQFDEFSRQKGDLTALYIERHNEAAVRKNLRDVATTYGIEAYYLYDQDGTELMAAGKLAKDDLAEVKDIVDEETAVTKDGIRYYASTTSTNKTLIYGVDYSDETENLSSVTDLEGMLSTIYVGTNGSILAIDNTDNTIAYAKDSTLIGEDAATVIPTADVRGSGYVGYGDIHGQTYYVETGSAGSYTVLSIVPKSELSAANHLTIGLVLLLFTVVITIVVLYAAFIREEESTQELVPLGPHWFLDKVMLFKIKNVIIVGMIIIVCASFYIQTLSPLARQGTLNDNKLASVESILDTNKTKYDDVKQTFESEYTALMQGIAHQLEVDDDYSSDRLQEIADRANLVSVSIVNSEGQAVAASNNNITFRLSENEEDQSYQFWDILHGYANQIIQSPQEDDSGNSSLWMAYRLEMDDEIGMLQICVDPKLYAARTKTTEIGYVLDQIAVENDGFLFAVSTDDKHTILSWPTAKAVGKSAADYGITDTVYQPDYSGFQTISDVQYLVTSTQYNDAEYIMMAVPLTSIYRTRVMVTAWTVVVSFLILGVLTARLVLVRRKTEQAMAAVEKEEAKEAAASAASAASAAGAADAVPSAGASGTQDASVPSADYYITKTDSGRGRLVQSAASRWSDRKLNWSGRNADAKIGFIAEAVVLLLIGVLTLYLLLFRQSAMQNTIVAYILNRKWEKGVNIFSVTYVVAVMAEVILSAWIVRKLITYVMSKFGARSETVARLLDSFIKYAAIIGAIFHCMGAMGVDTTALMTGAGILSLVVGLGANKLISDIVAGIFIVFEGAFRVGDIIEVGGWRGTVVEIGIRTTKVDNGGNIKIFSNSSITDVINTTKQFSTAYIEVGIEYGESLERVEAILAKELPNIKSEIPAIIHGPYYKGVVSLGASSVNIRISAQVHEKDVWQVQCDLNREIKLLFDQYDIAIPFQQIVVNEPEVFKKATAHEKRVADAFNDEQKVLSQYAETTENKLEPAASPLDTIL